MAKTLVCFAASLLVLFGVSEIYAQKLTRAKTNANLPSKQFRDLRIKTQGIQGFFTRLSLSYEIPIGLEIASRDDEFAFYEVDLKTGSLTELLNQFTERHNQYAWKIEDGVVNIFPKDAYRDFGLNELLNVQVTNFSLKEKSSCWKLVDSLLGTPEVQNALKTYGMTRSGLNFSGGYFPQVGSQFTLQISNKTLKAILNIVVRESPLAKIWFIKKYSSDQTFLLTLNARHEESLPNGFDIFE